MVAAKEKKAEIDVGAMSLQELQGYMEAIQSRQEALLAEGREDAINQILEIAAQFKLKGNDELGQKLGFSIRNSTTAKKTTERKTGQDSGPAFLQANGQKLTLRAKGKRPAWVTDLLKQYPDDKELIENHGLAEVWEEHRPDCEAKLKKLRAA